MFGVKVVADSIGPSGARITTVEACYERFIHAEVLTHRDRARNSQSSRAKPWTVLTGQVENDPVIPLRWLADGTGMRSDTVVAGNIGLEAERIWLSARDDALRHARRLGELGIHKSLVNRIVEPFMWINTVMTATHWENFFRLRCHPDAEQHFQRLACAIRDSIKESKPAVLQAGDWHLPYIEEDDYDAAEKLMTMLDITTLPDRVADLLPRPISVLKAASVARCARVTYKPFNSSRKSLERDLDTFIKLLTGSMAEDMGTIPHASPMEHVAVALLSLRPSGPFRGWRQYREQIPNNVVSEYEPDFTPKSID